MADAADLKSASRKGVWVRIPSSAPIWQGVNSERAYFRSDLLDLGRLRTIVVQTKPLCYQ